MFQPDLFSTNWGVGNLANFIDFGLVGKDVARPAPLTVELLPKPANPHLITFRPGPKTHMDVQISWETLPKELRYGRMVLTFDHPVSMQIGSRKISAPKKQHIYKLYVGDCGGYNVMAYTSRRHGWSFQEHHLKNLVSIEPVKTIDEVERVRKLANRIHPNAWDDLKVKLLTDPAKYYGNYGYTVTSITGKFPDYVLENVRHAFEEKNTYKYDTGGFFSNKKTGRDLRVECKLCDDGIFRAWFYSEFPGCANGDYWLLLNPSTAAFKERD